MIPTENDIAIYCMSAQMSPNYNEPATREGIKDLARIWARDFKFLSEDKLCDKIVGCARDYIRTFNWSEDDMSGVAWSLGLYTHVVLEAGLANSFMSVIMPAMRKYFNNINNDTFNFNRKYDYSIDVAKVIYKSGEYVKSYEDLKQAIIKYLNSNGYYDIQENCSSSHKELICEQLSFMPFIYDNDIKAISLRPLNHPLTYKIIDDIFANKAIFGLPVFNILCIKDDEYTFPKFEMATIHFITKESYEQLDTPQNRLFQL